MILYKSFTSVILSSEEQQEKKWIPGMIHNIYQKQRQRPKAEALHFHKSVTLSYCSGKDQNALDEPVPKSTWEVQTPQEPYRLEDC